MSTTKFPDHWLVNARVWLHLMTLGVTPEEIAQLETLVMRLVGDFFADSTWSFHSYVPASKIFIRMTARAQKHKGSKLFGLKPFKSRNRPRGTQPSATVFVLPKTRAEFERLDPWWPLWKIHAIDLDMKPY